MKIGCMKIHVANRNSQLRKPIFMDLAYSIRDIGTYPMYVWIYDICIIIIYIYISMYHRVNVVKVLMLIRFFACGSFVLPHAGDAFSILAAHISREAWSLEVLVPQLGLSPVTQWVITQLLTSYYVGLSSTAYTEGGRQSNFRFRLSRSAEHGTKYSIHLKPLLSMHSICTPKSGTI